MEDILERSSEVGGTDNFNHATDNFNHATEDFNNATDDFNNATNSDDLFASVLLAKSALYLQPEQRKYYPLWTNVTSNTLHNMVFLISNGSVSSCMDGYFIEDNPKLTLWNTSINIDTHPVRINFTQHLHAIQRLVSRVCVCSSTHVLCTLQ